MSLSKSPDPKKERRGESLISMHDGVLTDIIFLLGVIGGSVLPLNVTPKSAEHRRAHTWHIHLSAWSLRGYPLRANRLHGLQKNTGSAMAGESSQRAFRALGKHPPLLWSSGLPYCLPLQGQQKVGHR